MTVVELQQSSIIYGDQSGPNMDRAYPDDMDSSDSDIALGLGGISDDNCYELHLRSASA